jgi:hypothetical protein
VKNHGQSNNTITRSLANAQIAHAASSVVFDARDVASVDALSTVFRIYTEDTGDDFPEHVTRIGFDGATMFSATGIYKGQTERSAVLEIIAPYGRRADVLALTVALVDAHHQECAILSWQNARVFDSTFVFGSR